MNANERKHNINAKQSKEVWLHIRSRPKNKGMWATGKAKRRNPNLSGNIIVKLTKCASPVGVSNTNWDWKSQNTCHRIQLKPFQLRVDLYATMGEELGKRSKMDATIPNKTKPTKTKCTKWAQCKTLPPVNPQARLRQERFRKGRNKARKPNQIGAIWYQKNH